VARVGYFLEAEKKTKLDRYRVRMSAVEVLRTMKQTHTYEDLSALTGLPVAVLSRYVNGHVFPSVSRASKLIKIFKEDFLVEAVKERICFTQRQVFDQTRLLSDVALLGLIAKVALEEFGGEGITKVLTKETAGIPLATLAGKELGADLLIAIEQKEMAVNEFIEVERAFSDGTYTYLYLPKGLMGEKDNVLIVDDCIRTGSAVRAMAEMCKVTGAKLKGVFVVAGIGDTPARVGGELKRWFPPRCPVKSLVRFWPPPRTGKISLAKERSAG